MGNPNPEFIHQQVIKLAASLAANNDLPPVVRIASAIMLSNPSDRTSLLINKMMNGRFIEQNLDEAKEVVEYFNLVNAGFDSFLKAHPALAALMEESEKPPSGDGDSSHH